MKWVTFFKKMLFLSLFFIIFPIMDMNSFLKRKNLKHKELAEKLECSQALIGSYAYNSAVPSYENAVKLLNMGMTIEELFGKEVADNVVVKLNAPKYNISSEDIKEAVIKEICDRLLRVVA